MEKMDRYLSTHHGEEIEELLTNPEELVHVSIGDSLTRLARHEPTLNGTLMAGPRAKLVKWGAALWQAQKNFVEGPNLFLEPGFRLKHLCHVRFTNMPPSSEGGGGIGVKKGRQQYPSLDQVGRLMRVSGTVIRRTQATKFVEYNRDYVCKRCKHEFEFETWYEQKYVFNARGCVRYYMFMVKHVKETSI